MNVSLFLQQMVNGLTVGSIYALIALGYTMVYGVLKLINFAHGDLFALGAYIGLSLTAAIAFASLPSLLSFFFVLLLVAFGVALVGVLLERVAYRPVRGAGRLPALVSALGASVFLQNAVMLIWGAQPRAFPGQTFLPERTWTILGVEMTTMQLFILSLSALLMLVLHLFVQQTKIGMALRAIAVDQQTARLMGIDVERLIVLIFIIGPALGGLAGVMIGLYYGQLTFTMGWQYGLKAFTVAILGGIGNIPGAMLGGLLLGVIEALAAGYVSGNWKEAVAFVVLILILLFRPTGLLGERVAEKI